MNLGQTVFSQLIEHLPHKEFQKCVARYRGDHYLKSFSCWDQFLAMSFAQLTYRESLRDIEACLRSMQSKLYHMGFRGKVSRSTLADANELRDWRIYADFAQVLIGIARPLYADDPLGVELNENLYALDSTTIDLCLSLFPWARFRRHKAAVKMHTLLDLHGSIPTFIRITEGKTHDVNILDQIIPEAGSFYVMDRGYVDFERLHLFTLCSAFFVVRSKENILLQRRYSHPVDRSSGVRSDHTVILTASESAKVYPDTLRRVTYFDLQNQKRLKFLTNNFFLPALTIAKIYKSRWMVELFFKFIKQHLRIKSFYGTSENAVKTQIWIAVSIYVLVAIVRKRLRLEVSFYQILQILSLTLFEKMPILRALEAIDSHNELGGDANQLILFEF
ncbi:MAG: IS4 family transposase [Acidobacteria bacterium]|nr:MAG: IS4 family transposase [Acidobacteriota bacterium]